MSRTTMFLPYKDFENTNRNIQTVLQGHGYRLVEEEGELVWKRGNGIWEARRFIKIEYAENNMVLLSGWVKPPFGREQDLDGFVGVIPKKDVKKVIQQIQIAFC